MNGFGETSTNNMSFDSLLGFPIKAIRDTFLILLFIGYANKDDLHMKRVVYKYQMRDLVCIIRL
jgi:hypothetical protein